MKSMYLVLPLLLALAAPATAAEKMSPLEAALTECATKVKKDSEGLPDQKAMAECMKARGFGEAAPSGKAKGK